MQITKKLFKTSFNFILIWFSPLGFYLDSPLGVKVQLETSQKEKMAGPAIVNSENVTQNILCDPWFVFFKHKFNILLFCR